MRMVLFSVLLAAATACESDSVGNDDADAASANADAGSDAALNESPDGGAGPPVLGGGSECDLYAMTRGLAEDSNDVPPVDCGVAVMSAPGSWLPLSNCLLENLNQKKAFYGAFELDNSSEPDSTRAFGFIGIAGPPFVLKQVFWDSDPSGGSASGVPPRGQLHQCVEYGPREDCTPGPGWVCIGCFDQKNPDLTDLCPGWAPSP